MPVSATDSSMWSSYAFRSTETLPPVGVYFTALLTRLSTTWAKRCGSTMIRMYDGVATVRLSSLSSAAGRADSTAARTISHTLVGVRSISMGRPSCCAEASRSVTSRCSRSVLRATTFR